MNINYLTTPESLRSTIQDDLQIYEWFLNLISQEKFRQNFGLDPDRKRLCQNFDRQKALQLIMTFPLVISLILPFWLESYWLFGVTVLLMIVQIWTAKQLRKYVAEISLQKINDDFPANQLAQTTLYQLGEFYSKKYAS